MRVERTKVEDQTAFVIQELSERERQAAYALEWFDIGEGVGTTFPVGTSLLDVASRNFEKCAPQLIAQRAGLAAIPWQDALRSTLAKLSSRWLLHRTPVWCSVHVSGILYA